MKKVIKIVVLISIGVIGLFASIQNNRNILPLNLDHFPTINISTPDANNPNIKFVTFETMVVNKSKEPVDVRFHFTKKEGVESWYPYYKIIPDLHETEAYHIEPGQIEDSSSVITVETDDNRLKYLILNNVSYENVYTWFLSYFSLAFKIPFCDKFIISVKLSDIWGDTL